MVVYPSYGETTMKFAVRAAFALLVLSASGLVSAPADAETKLTDFNGAWLGSGSDRNTPFEAEQRTTCRSNITADLQQMTSNIQCKGTAGLTKAIHLHIRLRGNSFTGTLSQRAATRGGATSKLAGSVSGQKTDTTANFRVTFPGLTPSVDVTLRLNNPSSFSMRATTFVGELMNVTFKRMH